MLRGLVLLSLLFASLAHAERRMALLVGANEGWATDRPLRYAQDDARRVRDVLTQLGQVSASDAVLLLEPDTRALDAALARIERELADTHESTVFLFYYSGHSDAESLHLRGPPLGMTALANRLSAIKAGVTVAVVDSCRSGAMVGMKGAMPVAPLRLLADEPVQGFALLSSSGADELAQESRALAGSIFTHHWISALRGAGDVDGDGAVRLSEAYGYAYERTRTDTESTALPQRPAFRFSLKGQGDLVLTRLLAAAATLELEVEPSRRYVVVDGDEQHLVAEARSDPAERRRLQLAAGSYRLKRPGRDGIDVAEVTLAAGSVVWAARLDYRKEPVERGLLKGGSMFSDWAATSTLAQGDVSAAIDMFQRILAEDPHEERARRGFARALLARSLELKASGKKEEELKVLQDALSYDPGFADDPSMSRFADRARALVDEREQLIAAKNAAEEELANAPRLTKRWGLGFLLLSTKGIVVVEGHWMPKPWLTVTLAFDAIGPGVDLSVRVVPLKTAWSPTIGLGAHYGFDAWQRSANGGISINGQPLQLAYDDFWGKMFHADLGMQWMAKAGFTGEFGAGPMLFYNPISQRFEFFGFLTIGMGWYFH